MYIKILFIILLNLINCNILTIHFRVVPIKPDMDFTITRLELWTQIEVRSSIESKKVQAEISSSSLTRVHSKEEHPISEELTRVI